MFITRRQFLKYCSVAAGALGLTTTDLVKLKEALATEGGAPVIWLHGASCSGDSTSLLNTIFYMDPVQLLVTDNVDLEFHQTVMNASGTDLPVVQDPLDVAQGHLPIAVQGFAGWSTETFADGWESIKLRVADRAVDGYYADAKIYPVKPLLLNEFDIYFKFKTSEDQAPYVELDMVNQDTGAQIVVSSHYPGVTGDPFPGGGEIFGPKDWPPAVDTHDFELWTLGVQAPQLSPITMWPGLAPPAAGEYLTLAQLRSYYGTYKVWRVKIINGGNSALYGSPPQPPCTMYIDEIQVGGIHYEDGSTSIEFNLNPSPSEDPFVLCIEGSILTATPPGGTLPGEYCEVGPMVTPGDPNETMLHAFLEYAKQAAVVLAIGTCASFGGIPAASGSVTGAKGCAEVLAANGIMTPVVNIPGCPAHPDWIVGTVAQYLAKGLVGIRVDAQGRPKDYYPHYVCNGNIDVKCPWILNNTPVLSDLTTANPDYNPLLPVGDSMALAKYKWSAPTVAESYGVYTDGTNATSVVGCLYEGCLGVLGCRGRKTKADCAYRKWNAATQLTPGTLGVNWCVGSRGACQGCTDPGFPSNSRFYTFI